MLTTPAFKFCCFWTSVYSVRYAQAKTKPSICGVQLCNMMISHIDLVLLFDFGAIKIDAGNVFTRQQANMCGGERERGGGGGGKDMAYIKSVPLAASS